MLKPEEIDYEWKSLDEWIEVKALQQVDGVEGLQHWINDFKPYVW
jgi:hypothetical protein